MARSPSSGSRRRAAPRGDRMAGEGAGPGLPLSGRRVLLGVTGGVAAYKSVLLLRLMTEAGADVRIVMTPSATRFVGPDTFAALSHHPVHSDVFDRTDAVLHVRLAHEADVAAKGGYVLMQDGTVKKMTAAEFQSAPKAKL